MPLAGVLGHPVGHSRSPAMMNAAFAELGLDWRYVKLPVPPDLFAATVRALPASGYRGANVTIPHKLAARELADDVSDAVAAIGAANTLTFANGVIRADNTDAGGLIAAIGRPVAGMRALVLGAGGAGRAAVWALRGEGAEVSVWNRTPRPGGRAGRGARRGPRRAPAGGGPAGERHLRGTRPGASGGRGAGPPRPSRHGPARGGGGPRLRRCAHTAGGLGGARRRPGGGRPGGAGAPGRAEPQPVDGPRGAARRDALARRGRSAARSRSGEHRTMPSSFGSKPLATACRYANQCRSRVQLSSCSSESCSSGPRHSP